MGKDCMEIFQIGTSIKIIADVFETYVEETAEHVSGDVVLNALKHINSSKKKAKEFHSMSRTHTITIQDHE